MNLLKTVQSPLPALMQFWFLMVVFIKQSTKPVIKDSRVESIEEARKEYKKLLKEGWTKTYRFNIKKKWILGTLPKIWQYLENNC